MASFLSKVVRSVLGAGGSKTSTSSSMILDNVSPAMNFCPPLIRVNTAYNSLGVPTSIFALANSVGVGGGMPRTASKTFGVSLSSGIKIDASLAS